MSSPMVVQRPDSPAPHTGVEAHEIAKWQRKLLPFMTRFLAVIAIAFFALSAYDAYEVRQFMDSDRTPNLRSGIEEIVHARVNAQSSSPADLISQSLLILEAESMEKRYRQASALLMSRIWTRQLAFMTGMVLAFMGSIFILGKMTENKTDVGVAMEQWKGTISSTSPGLILAFFGTVLMAISLIVQPKIEVQDRPLYFTMTGLAPNPNAQKATTTTSASPNGNTDAYDAFDSTSKPVVKR